VGLATFAGLWYDDKMTEARVMESWGKISAELCSQWNVFGVDLQHEPVKASWSRLPRLLNPGTS
jgi:hypothetical protein